jgi:sigma-B regulation protein RsbU (phosphoserine phosphatase)
MTTARAHLIAGVPSFTGGVDLIGSVNRFLTHDIQETGWFITLFWLEIDPVRRRLAWIRAGHDPALFYDPDRDHIEHLDGEGLALGIDSAYTYREYERNGWQAGSIILVGTDGLRETRNALGHMYGIERLQRILRDQRERPAADIKNAILASIEAFRQDQPREDDTTLVVIKLK